MLGFGRNDPGGRNSNVLIIAQGTTGARDSRASLATPVLPLYSRPSGDRVPSG
jgi:hypothetical protein